MSDLSTKEFLDELRALPILSPERLEQVASDAKTEGLAEELVAHGWLTPFQAKEIRAGRASHLMLGSYLLLDELGGGGMGQVFKAKHVRLERIVALKIVRPDLLDNAELLHRFQREARLAARLNHPNIVAIHDADAVGGTHFFTMEYVPGKNLAVLVREHGLLQLPQACEVIAQVSRGLQHAHELGMVHRDIKPSNLIMHEPTTTVKILDMGLTFCPGTDDSLTGSRMGFGTPDYMAPEQRLDAHGVDIRADLYSLGCTLHFLLTGQPPARYAGGIVGDPKAATTATLADGLPADFLAILRKLLAATPRERFQTPAELEHALLPFCRAQLPATETFSRPMSAEQPVARRAVLNRWLLGSAALLIAVAACVGVTLWLLQRAAGPSTWVISRTGSGANSFHTIREALQHAASGDTIVIVDDLHEEHLQLDQTFHLRNVTIQGRTPGQTVWRSPTQGNHDALLSVQRVDALCVRDLVLDGGDRLPHLVRIAGVCPGLRLENCELRSCRQSALVIANGAGQPSQPISLTGLRFVIQDSKAAALAFTNPDGAAQPSEHVRVNDCVFLGPAWAFVDISNALAKVSFEGNRLYDADCGLYFNSRKINPCGGFDVQVLSNTFCKFKKAVLLMEPDCLVEKSSQFLLQNNLFLDSAAIVSSSKLSAEVNGNARWIAWAAPGATGSRPGPRFYRSGFRFNRKARAAALHLFCDETFSAWYNGVEIAKDLSGKRYYRLDVPLEAPRLTRDCLAVQCEYGGANTGFLAQLTVDYDNGPSTVLWSDNSWPAQTTPFNDWHMPESNPEGWPRAAQWHVVPLQLTGAVGNVRDEGSSEGSMSSHSNRFPTSDVRFDVQNLEEFLTYSTTSVLYTAGQAKSPVGFCAKQKR